MAAWAGCGPRANLHLFAAVYALSGVAGIPDLQVWQVLGAEVWIASYDASI